MAGIDADLDDLRVEPMDDGGMGSMRFFSQTPDPEFGRKVAGCIFNDDDGVSVWATLNLDQDGRLFEVDVWKVDFSQLFQWPEEKDINDEPPNKSLH